MEKELTFGQKAVGLPFNPSGDECVIDIKKGCADLIDKLNNLRTGDENSKPDMEVARMASVAITELQTAQMWAVKALTWGTK